MNSGRKGLSTAVMAVGVLILLVVVGAAGYYVGTSSVSSPNGGAPSTTTVTVSGGNGGGGATTTVTTTATASGGGAISQSLIDAAKAEGGSVTYYTTSDQVFVQNLTNAFKAQFPWANVNFVATTSAALATRVPAEVQAGKPADLIAIVNPLLQQWEDNGTIQKLSLPDVGNYSSFSLQDKNGYWYSVSQVIYGVVYNTNLVTAAQAPKSIQDLANPAWNNQIAIDGPSRLQSAGVTFSQYYFSMGNSSWTTLMKGIAANHPSIQGSNTAAGNAVAAGSAKIGIVSLNTYNVGRANGEPLQWIWFPQMPLNPQFLVMPKGAQHPNMAKLFAEWQLMEPGQNVLGKFGFIPQDSFVASYYHIAAPSNVTLIPSAPDYQKPTYGGLVSAYMQIFGA